MVLYFFYSTLPLLPKSVQVALEKKNVFHLMLTHLHNVRTSKHLKIARILGVSHILTAKVN